MKTIKKVKMKDDAHLLVDYILIQNAGESNQVERDVTENIKKQLHPDLINRFERLRIHFGLLAEFIELEDISPNMFGELENFSAYEHKGVKQLVCNQIIFSGAGDDKGVQLAGRKILRQGKPLNCITPVVKLHNEDDFYPYKVDLNNDIELVLEETDGALDGKFWESPQVDMDFSDQGKSKEVISMNIEKE